jgi:glycosyltransferase involved in cell wall biosynthesis
LPVIGSSVGGINTLIQNGVNGLLVKPADPAQLAENIKKLLRDPAGARILGDNARNFINDNFVQESMVKYTEEVYSECLNS